MTSINSRIRKGICGLRDLNSGDLDQHLPGDLLHRRRAGQGNQQL